MPTGTLCNMGLLGGGFPCRAPAGFPAPPALSHPCPTPHMCAICPGNVERSLVCEPPQAARKWSPWRAIPLQMARASCLQTGALGATTVCTLVGIANRIQVGVEMGPKGLSPLHRWQKGWYKLAGGSSEQLLWALLSSRKLSSPPDRATPELRVGHMPEAVPGTWQASLLIP